MNKQKLQPKKTIIRVMCANCGEIMLKIYPNCSIVFNGLDSNVPILKGPPCINCQNKSNKLLARSRTK